MTDFFADRLSNISIANGVVRMEFVTISSLDTENKKAEFRPSVHLAMPIGGAMQTLEVLQNVRRQLEEQSKKENEL